MEFGRITSKFGIFAQNKIHSFVAAKILYTIWAWRSHGL